MDVEKMKTSPDTYLIENIESGSVIEFEDHLYMLVGKHKPEGYQIANLDTGDLYFLGTGKRVRIVDGKFVMIGYI